MAKKFKTETLGNLILINLINNKRFFEDVIPYIKAEYFDQEYQTIMMDTILKFYNEYDKQPTRQTLKIDIDNRRDISNASIDAINDFFTNMEYKKSDYNWLYRTTETFCRNNALHNAINKAYFVYDNKDKTITRDEIPEMIEEALSLSFDDNVGYTYIDDKELQYEHYHDETERMTFDIEAFNQITRGGIERKTLTILASGVNKGKTTFMCQFAAHSAKQGKNVLYISLEMGDEWIAEKLDTNLLSMTSEEIIALSKEEYFAKIENLGRTMKGKLIIKQYPSSGVHVGHFKSLLKDLRRKKGFKPDILIIDYINNCIPMRGLSRNGGTYEYIKIVAEEVRSLALTENIAIVSPTQLNRTGAGKKDAEMEDVAESWGLPQTCDRFWIMQSDKSMEAAKIVKVEQKKKRDGSKLKDKPIYLLFDSDRSRFCYTDIDDHNLEEHYKPPASTLPDIPKEPKTIKNVGGRSKGMEKFSKNKK